GPPATTNPMPRTTAREPSEMPSDNLSTIPTHALERLKGLRTSLHSSGIFTSDFTVNEFLLVRKAGFEPIGLCVGTCVYHVGIQYGNWTKNQELDVLSKAMYHARELAMSRMRAEASAMGADGIVGVKLTIKRLEWDAHLLEFIAIGTAVLPLDQEIAPAKIADPIMVLSVND